MYAHTSGVWEHTGFLGTYDTQNIVFPPNAAWAAHGSPAPLWFPGAMVLFAATHCNTLQHTAAHCSTQQHAAAQCSTLQHALQHTATHCSTLQHTAAHCNTLQHAPTHCNTV